MVSPVSGYKLRAVCHDLLRLCPVYPVHSLLKVAGRKLQISDRENSGCLKFQFCCHIHPNGDFQPTFCILGVNFSTGENLGVPCHDTAAQCIGGRRNEERCEAMRCKARPQGPMLGVEDRSGGIEAESGCWDRLLGSSIHCFSTIS